MFATKLKLLSFCLYTIVLIPIVVIGEEIQLVPEKEHQNAESLGFKGPLKTIGVASFEVLGTVPLVDDFPELAENKLRARKIIFKPGSKVKVHQHDSRPGILYVLDGELTEHREGQAGPVVKRKGDTAFEKTGIIHWWENESSKNTTVLLIDIVPLDL
jgi:quercetin dioxygenase-like cupin family protein